MQVKIVLVKSLYEENLGLVARAMANFGFTELSLVKPECNWLSNKAKSRAMHGKAILQKAKKFKSINEATKDCTYSVAASAKKGRNRNSIPAKEFAKLFAKSKAKIALVFGPEPSGLTNKEIEECDIITTITASPKYPTLNLSHAVCLMLYQLFSAKEKPKSFKEATPATKKQLQNLFEKNLLMLASIDDKKAVKASFKALTSRSLITEKEALSLIAFLSEKRKGLTRKQRRND